jgi:hypothetical protein
MLACSKEGLDKSILCEVYKRRRICQYTVNKFKNRFCVNLVPRLKEEGMVEWFIAPVLKTKILPRKILPPSKNSCWSRTKTNAFESKIGNKLATDFSSRFVAK